MLSKKKINNVVNEEPKIDSFDENDESGEQDDSDRNDESNKD